MINIDREYRESTNEYILHATNDSQMRYTIELDFSLLMNYRVSPGHPYRYTVHPGRSHLCKLTRIDENASANFSYSYRYYPGCASTKIRDIVYAMPVGRDVETEVFNLTYLGEEYGNKEAPKDWYAIGFKMQEGDTIYASRKGVVIEVDDQYGGTEKENVLFLRGVNRVLVEHRDCTRATYSLFRHGGILVQEGQQLDVGDPMGVVGGDNFESGPHVRFTVTYSHLQEVNPRDDSEKTQQYWAYVEPRFLHNGVVGFLPMRVALYNDYDHSVIEQEMSNREKKRRRKK